MAASADIKRYLANLDDERNSAALYRAIAEWEKDPKIAEVYRRLAATEEDHAGAWAERLRAAGGDVPEFRWYSGARQVLFGLCAAAVSFLIGRVIGVSIAG